MRMKLRWPQGLAFRQQVFEQPPRLLDVKHKIAIESQHVVSAVWSCSSATITMTSLITSKSPRAIDHQSSSLFFSRLPVEIRLMVYEYVLGPTKPHSLYLAHDVWTWNAVKVRRRFLNIFLVCGQMYRETVDILYARHELSLYGTHWPLQTRLGALRDYTRAFLSAHRIRLTLFVTGELAKDNVLVALMGWLKAILAERTMPLKLLTLEFCAVHPTLRCQPTALLYAAQGFRSLGPTMFVFQCGFSGVGSERAMEALMQHANEKIRAPSGKPISAEEAYKRYSVAWNKSQPAGLASHVRA